MLSLKTKDRKKLKVYFNMLQYLFFQFFALFAVINFIFRRLFFGYKNATNYLVPLDSAALVIILKLYGARIGKNCDLQPGIIFHNCKNFKNLKIGNNCHIGKNCFFDLRDSITIEDNVVISMNCDFITHQDMSKSPLSKKYPAICKPIYIGSGSYFGCDVTTLMGVIIGENSIIGAKSLVNSNTERNTFYAGIPAKKIKKINVTI